MLGWVMAWRELRLGYFSLGDAYVMIGKINEVILYDVRLC